MPAKRKWLLIINYITAVIALCREAGWVIMYYLVRYLWALVAIALFFILK